MKYTHLLLLIPSLVPVCSYAESVAPIDPQVYGMQKKFGPPQPITPKNVLTTTPDNQFDLTKRDNPNVVNAINDRMDRPFHITTALYGDKIYSGALWRQREADYYVIGSLAYTRTNNYKDGDGNTVDYGYDRKSGALVLGYLPNGMSEHRLTLVYDNIGDDKQPQYKIDPIETQRMIGKYNLRVGSPDDNNTLHIELSAIDMERHANNFDLRNNPSAAPKIFMDVEKQKYTADIHFNHRFNEQNKSTIGLLFDNETQDAKRFRKTPIGNVLNGYRFADVNKNTTRVYVGHDWQPSEEHNLKGALSFDWQTADVRGANKKFMRNVTSAKIWKMYYGKNLDSDIKQEGLSGTLRYAFTPNDTQEFYGKLESLYRMPENPERFAVLPAPPGSRKGWASDPWINPERENRVTLGLKINGSGWGGYQTTKQDDFASAWQVSGDIYYADVDDFITLDRYRGNKMPLRGNVISRNVDAKLAGVNVSVQKNWTQNLSTSLGASYQYGQNETDNRPLYQVTPFEANLNVDWKGYFDGGSYSVGSRVRYQQTQNRRDDNPMKGLGIDNATDGFTTLDIYSGVNWKDSFGVSLGVDNVFDENYAEFTTGNHVEAISPSSVNAPERTFWVRLNASF